MFDGFWFIWLGCYVECLFEYFLMYGLLLWFVVVNLLLCSNGCMFGEVDFFVDVLDGWCLYWEFVVKCYLCVLVCDGVLFVDFVGFNFVDWFDCKCSWLFDY